MNTMDCVKACLLHAAAARNPAIAVRTARFLSQLRRPGARIHYKSLTFQQGPSLDANGELDYCRDCPDATVRNGHLVPVCLADILEPQNLEEFRIPAAAVAP